MARYERGVYEPPADDIRVFDASEEDDDTEGSRLPLLIVIALLVLAAFGGVVYLAYTQGVARGRADGPRVITADAGPVKTAPGDAGNGTPYQGLKIYEQPAPTDEEVEQDTAPPPPTPVEEAAPAAPPAPPVQAAPAKPVVTAEAAKPVVAPPPKPVATAPVKPAVTATPPAKPIVATAPPAPLKPAPAKPVPAPATTAAPAASGGTYYLQIGSFKSEADANAAWRAYAAKHGGLTNGYSPNIVKTDLGEKGTWYRLRMGSFSSKESANAMCGKLGGGCLLAR